MSTIWATFAAGADFRCPTGRRFAIVACCSLTLSSPIRLMCHHAHQAICAIPRFQCELGRISAVSMSLFPVGRGYEGLQACLQACLLAEVGVGVPCPRGERPRHPDALVNDDIAWENLALPRWGRPFLATCLSTRMGDPRQCRTPTPNPSPMGRGVLWINLMASRASYLGEEIRGLGTTLDLFGAATCVKS